MNIIFLDVQGVLTSHNYKDEKNRNLNPKKIKLLKKIIKKTNSQIVLISNWRKYKTKKEINNRYKVLEKNLKKYNIKIYDCVASYAKDINKENDKRYTYRSGFVYDYIKKNNIEKYVIIDDRDQKWNLFNLEKHVVKTKNKKGLRRKDIRKAIKIIRQI